MNYFTLNSNAMKKIILLLIAIFLFSCDREKKTEPEPLMKLQEGYIIGFDPCVRFGSHVIVTNNYKDTLVAYLYYDDFFINRLDTIYKFPDYYTLFNTDTVYQFPDHYYHNYQVDFRFPDSVINKYKIYINYTYLNEVEKIPIVCTWDIYPHLFDKYVRDRQIKINYATKYPAEYVKLK